MSSIFKKALGLFVEFEPEEPKASNPNSSWSEDGLPIQVKQKARATGTADNSHLPANTSRYTLSQGDIDKFDKHFSDLFDKVNLPGPDYYEFWKMMETLEAAVPDEAVRMNAVFSTLKVQGLSKETLISSAEKYLEVVDKDKLEFQNAVNSKVLGEIEGRKTTIDELEKKNQQNAEMIQKLTQEISDNNQKITSLKKEVIDEEAKINGNTNGYNIACDAMLAQLSSDIQKIKTSL
jgi:predicted nuclease with TOPRIM domain